MAYNCKNNAKKPNVSTNGFVKSSKCVCKKLPNLNNRFIFFKLVLGINNIFIG